VRVCDMNVCVSMGGAHSPARVGICLIYLETEGGELRKDPRAPPSTFAKGQLLVSFL